MERQRTGSSPSRLASTNPKSLLLISFVSSSLLFSFLFSLFALRFGRPLHLPFAASIGANGSATAVSPVPGGGGGGLGVEVEAEAFIGGGGGPLGEDSAVEADRRGRAAGGGLPVGSAMKVDEAVLAGGVVETPAGGTVSERPGGAEAGSYSPRGLDSAMEAKGVVQGGGDGERLAKDSVSEKPNPAEGEDLNEAGAVSARRSNAGNASASSGTSAASVEKLGQWKMSNHSAAEKNSGEAPVNPNKQTANVIQEAVPRKVELARSNAAQCDVYDGRWVFDESYPLYTSNSCPFVDEGFSCEANGITEQNYTKCRWQPRHCDIPRFDARKMLEMLRGKRLVFVGDSLNRNQWESMMCLLREAVSDPARIHEARGRKITKERGDYNFSVLRYCVGN